MLVALQVRFSVSSTFTHVVSEMVTLGTEGGEEEGKQGKRGVEGRWGGESRHINYVVQLSAQGVVYKGAHTGVRKKGLSAL